MDILQQTTQGQKSNTSILKNNPNNLPNDRRFIRHNISKTNKQRQKSIFNLPNNKNLNLPTKQALNLNLPDANTKLKRDRDRDKNKDRDRKYSMSYD